MPYNDNRRAHGQEGLATRDGRLAHRPEQDALEPDEYLLPDGGRGGAPRRTDVIVAVVLIVLALISAFPVRMHFSSPNAYKHTIEQLDDKRNAVLGLTVAATGASAAITAIPDDVGTPIAEKLMDLSGDLLVVLTAIYVEKYLLTVFGAASFGLLIPAALVALAAFALFRHRSPLARALAGPAAKVLLMALLLVATIPTSVVITDMIDRTYDISISLDSQAEGGQGDATASGGSSGEGTDAGAVESTESDSSNADSSDAGVSDADAALDTEEKTWLEEGWELITGIPEALASGVSQVTEEMLAQVGNLIDGFAVMIVTSCVVPLGVLAFFLWAANLITGINVEAPMRALRPRSLGGHGGSSGPRPRGKKRPAQQVANGE